MIAPRKPVNKWQIICPLAAMLLFAFVAMQFSARTHGHAAFLASGRQVSRDLLSTTNSARLSGIPQELRRALPEFLGYPAGVASVRWHPVAQGWFKSPGIQILCTNAARESLMLVLRWEKNLKRFVPVTWAYTVPTPASQ